MSELFSYLNGLLSPRGVHLTSEAGLYVAVIALPLVWLAGRGIVGEGPPWYIRLPLLVLRTAFVLLLVAALLEPVRIERTSAPDALAVVDVSASIGDEEVTAIAARMTGVGLERGDARFEVLAFDGESVWTAPREASGLRVERDPSPGAMVRGSNPSAALLSALARLDPARDGRVLLVTDGLETAGDLLATAGAFADAGVPLHVMPSGARGDEVFIRSLALPGEVDLDADVTASLTIVSASAGDAAVTLRRAGEVTSALEPGGASAATRGTTRTIHLEPGTNTVTLSARATKPGHYRYLVEVAPAAGDRFATGNHAWGAVSVRGRPKVLLVREPEDTDEESLLARTLARTAEHYTIDEVSRDAFPATLAALDRYDLVVLNDPRTAELDEELTRRLSSWVGELGGGLLLAAGETSSDMADERETPFEELLPLEFRRIKRKERIPLAVCFVIDRSASMGREEKFGMALLAIDKATAEMQETSRVAIVTYSDAARIALPLTAASERTRIRDALESLSVGGGTDLFPGLTAAHDVLAESTAKIRHIIVLSDGESISRLHHSSDVVRRIVADHITISTVALSRDSDPAEMKAIAHLGGGRAYYVEHPADIPKIFTRETQRITDATVVNEDFRPVPVKRTAMIEGIDFAKGPPLRGFVASRKRATTEVILETETREPLLARWQYGLGTVTVWTSDARAHWAAEWIAWEGYGRLWDGLVRTTLRRRRPSSLRAVGAISRGGIATVEVEDVATALGGDDTRAPPTATLLGPGGLPSSLTLRRRGRSRWVAETSVSLPVYGLAIVAQRPARIHGAEPELAFASMSRPYLPESTRTGDDEALLERVAAAGGGRVVRSPEAAASALFAPGHLFSETQIPLWPDLLWWACGLFLADVLLRRLGLATGRTVKTAAAT